MVCYFPGTAFCGLIIVAAFWRAHHFIFTIVGTILRLGEFAGIALLAALALTAATLIMAFIAWTAHLIRRRRAGQSACLTCPHACLEAQVAAKTALPWPQAGGRPAASPSGPAADEPSGSAKAAARGTLTSRRDGV